MKVEDIPRNKDCRIATIRMNESIAIVPRLRGAESMSALIVEDACRMEGNVAVGMFPKRDAVVPLPAKVRWPRHDGIEPDFRAGINFLPFNRYA